MSMTIIPTIVSTKNRNRKLELARKDLEVYPNILMLQLRTNLSSRVYLKILGAHCPRYLPKYV